MLLAGMLAPARFVPRADRVRAAVRAALAEAFSGVDLIAWPCTPTAAPPRNTSSTPRSERTWTSFRRWLAERFCERRRADRLVARLDGVRQFDDDGQSSARRVLKAQ